MSMGEERPRAGLRELTGGGDRRNAHSGVWQLSAHVELPAWRLRAAGQAPQRQPIGLELQEHVVAAQRTERPSPERG